MEEKNNLNVGLIALSDRDLLCVSGGKGIVKKFLGIPAEIVYGTLVALGTTVATNAVTAEANYIYNDLSLDSDQWQKEKENIDARNANLKNAALIARPVQIVTNAYNNAHIGFIDFLRNDPAGSKQ